MVAALEMRRAQRVEQHGEKHEKDVEEADKETLAVALYEADEPVEHGQTRICQDYVNEAECGQTCKVVHVYLDNAEA